MPGVFLLGDGGGIQLIIYTLMQKPQTIWFGIYFRVGVNLLMGGYLVYVRQNGLLEIAVYPGPQVLQTIDVGQPMSGRQILMIEFENEYAEAQIGSVQLKISNLSQQTIGQVFPAAWNANVDLHSFEMVSRDTIDWKLP